MMFLKRRVKKMKCQIMKVIVSEEVLKYRQQEETQTLSPFYLCNLLLFVFIFLFFKPNPRRVFTTWSKPKHYEVKTTKPRLCY